VTALLLTGCRDFSVDDGGSENGIEDGTKFAQVGVPFELALGQEARLGETGLRMEFSMVTEETRCAINVQCISPGRAGILLTVLDEQFVRYQLVAFIPGLVATPYVNNDVIQFNDLRFRLLDVSPYPEDGVPRNASIYRIQMQVDPAF